MLAAEDLQRLGDALWAVRWNAIVYLDPENNSQLTIVKLATDMNADGAITVSDANLWLKWLFWLPGDYVFIALMKWAPSIAHFFELGPKHLFSWFSGFLSVMVYFFAWLIVAVFIESITAFIKDIRENGFRGEQRGSKKEGGRAYVLLREQRRSSSIGELARAWGLGGQVLTEGWEEQDRAFEKVEVVGLPRPRLLLLPEASRKGAWGDAGAFTASRDRIHPNASGRPTKYRFADGFGRPLGDTAKA